MLVCAEYLDRLDLTLMIFLLNFTGFYRNFGGLNPVVTSLIYVDLTLLGFTGYYRVLLNMNEFYWV